MGYRQFFGAHREATRGAVTVYEYERGLLYARGAFRRELPPGRYRLWPFTHRRIVVVDTRRASVQVVNQKLLTADQITVTLNLVADYEVTDVVAAVHRVANFRDQLYEDVQLAVRNLVGGAPIDVLLQERARLNEEALQAVRPAAAAYGMQVLQVGVKDVILAPRIRDLLLKEAEARRTAQATLIGAREEVAALRALANAARLAAEHPELLALRELDAIRAFAQTPGNTVVVGTQGNLVPRPRRAAPPAPERGEAPAEE
jgi:regulator of protease activity HflC (stomatin/prohibitin superfamily)